MHIYEKGTDITMLLRMLGGVSRLLKPPIAGKAVPTNPDNPETADKRESQSSPHPPRRAGVQVRSGKSQPQPAIQDQVANSVTRGALFSPETRTSRRNGSNARPQNPNSEHSSRNQDRPHSFQTQLFMVESQNNVRLMPLRIESRPKKGGENLEEDGGQEFSLFLFLENTGGIVLTVSSKGGQIGISFDVESKRTHDAFYAYLDELQSAIPGSENLRICVQVAPEKILSKLDSLSHAFHLDLMA